MCGIIGAYISKSNDLDVEKFNIIETNYLIEDQIPEVHLIRIMFF